VLGHKLEQRIVHRIPVPQSARAIGVELVGEKMIAGLIHHAFAEFAVENRGNFRSSRATHPTLP